jgi:Anti-sigma factor NepR
MSPRSSYLPLDRKSWLLAIGSRLRAEYDAVAEPVPERLAHLLARLDQPVADTANAGAGSLSGTASAVESADKVVAEPKGTAAAPPPVAPSLRDCRAAI